MRIYEDYTPELDESSRVAQFNRTSKKAFFATLSAFIDSSFFNNDATALDRKRHASYNNRATTQLLHDLKKSGLDYQKITGLWDGETENSFLVWNTAYTYEQFTDLMLYFAETYKQWAVCVGKWEPDIEKYDIVLWQTNSLDNIKYVKGDSFTTVSVVDALNRSASVLTRHIYDKDKNINPDKLKDAIMFEEIQRNPCILANNSLNGAYCRRDFIKALKRKQSLKNQPIAFMPDVQAGISTFNSLTEAQDVGVIPDEKVFEITYTVYKHGNAVHTTDVTARTYDDAIEAFYTEMDGQNMTPMIINCELVEG